MLAPLPFLDPSPARRFRLQGTVRKQHQERLDKGSVERLLLHRAWIHVYLHSIGFGTLQPMTRASAGPTNRACAGGC